MKKIVLKNLFVLTIFIMVTKPALAYQEKYVTEIYQLQKLDDLKENIFKLEKEIQALSGDRNLEYIEKQIEEMKSDIGVLESRYNELNEKKLSESRLTFWLVLIGGGILSIYLSIKKIIDERLKKILKSKSETLSKWILENEYEAIKRKTTKLLVVSNNKEGTKTIRKILEGIFSENNIVYKEWDNYKEIKDREFKLGNKDIIFYNNNGEDKEELTEKANQIAQDMVRLDTMVNLNGRKLCFFYYCDQSVNLKSDVIHKNFANTISTIYANIMSLLKYKDNVMNTNK